MQKKDKVSTTDYQGFIYQLLKVNGFTGKQLKIDR